MALHVVLGDFLRSRFGFVLDPLYSILKVHGGIKDEALATAILIALAIALFTTIMLMLMVCWSRRLGLRRSVLVVGLCESGKTLIYSQLVHRRHVATHTSVKENSGFYRSKNGKIATLLIDLPGHERLRMRLVDQYKSSSRGIIFVVDSSTVQTNLKDAAEYLYSLLSDQDIARGPNILIACNKQDMPLAKSSSVIKKQLELEMNTLRKTKEATLDTNYVTGGSDGISGGNVVNNNKFLGKRDKDFEFAQVHPFKIQFVECSAMSADGDGSCKLDSLEEWLAKIG